MTRALARLIDELTPAQRRELADFARFLATRNAVRKLKDGAPATGPSLDLPEHDLGTWTAGTLGRDEIYAEEADRVLGR